MKIDYISDLHLDFHISVEIASWKAKTFSFLSTLLPEEKGDLLVIAGDLSHANIQSFFLLEFFSSVYEQVLFVLGNHDYYLLHGEQQLKYEQDSQKREADLLHQVKALPNVTHLSYFETFNYRGVTFAGATSWYPLQTEQERRLFYHSLNDSRLIKALDIAATQWEDMPMKNFRTLDQAKKDLQFYLDYINLIEQYEPQSFVQRVIQEYVREGNLIRTAEILNRRGFHIEGRAIEPKDVKQAIVSSPGPDDTLHKEIRRLYLKKTSSTRVSSKPFRYQ